MAWACGEEVEVALCLILLLRAWKFQALRFLEVWHPFEMALETRKDARVLWATGGVTGNDIGRPGFPPAPSTLENPFPPFLLLQALIRRTALGHVAE